MPPPLAAVLMIILFRISGGIRPHLLGSTFTWYLPKAPMWSPQASDGDGWTSTLRLDLLLSSYAVPEAVGVSEPLLRWGVTRKAYWGVLSDREDRSAAELIDCHEGVGGPVASAGAACGPSCGIWTLNRHFA